MRVRGDAGSVWLGEGSRHFWGLSPLFLSYFIISWWLKRVKMQHTESTEESKALRTDPIYLSPCSSFPSLGCSPIVYGTSGKACSFSVRWCLALGSVCSTHMMACVFRDDTKPSCSLLLWKSVCLREPRVLNFAFLHSACWLWSSCWAQKVALSLVKKAMSDVFFLPPSFLRQDEIAWTGCS